MKLNPFTKKQKNTDPSRYDELCAQFVEAEVRFAASKAALEKAQADYDAKFKAFHTLEAKSQSTFWSTQEQTLHREMNRAQHHQQECQSAHRTIEREFNKLRSRIEAPNQLSKSKAQLAQLEKQHGDLRNELAKAQARQNQLQTRADQLAQDVENDQRLAAQALIDSDDEAPEIALPKGQAELHVVRAALEQIGKRIEELQTQLNEMPKRLRDALRSVYCNQATHAETELEEALPGFVGHIARYKVAQYRAGWTSSTQRHEIDIPDNAWEAANTRLDAEMRA
ncbi:myosin, heavy polypeptide 7B, cardiac muscle, beta isoform 1 [Lysobacter enzymogenes]|uniref:Myosin, heavy polypeptide 7B, cardiac muscle, beta isoform 1 n=1 Tax=Lysobacter enzymogenes TaxID=69 RepID=A0A0S2DQ48_LYSEN|nr:hypothetical protein [Lysobacter enzymogenes]ALN60875.1 myosin, heavy polypeptide 7B, cardiac muscle, beta isoform 1 [Lysobacter enzymogenes]QCW24439.1 hypothetical protein FE772_00890 [Lysobacter enzymogenes]